MCSMNPETRPFVLEVPLLEDETVNALHNFLLDLLTQFENQYFAQLKRYEQDLDEWCREQHETRSTIVDPDPDLNDDLVF